MVKRGSGNTFSKEKVEDEITKQFVKIPAAVVGQVAAHHLMGPEYGNLGAATGYLAAEPVADWLVNRDRKARNTQQQVRRKQVEDRIRQIENEQKQYNDWIIKKHKEDTSGSGLLSPDHPAMNVYGDSRIPNNMGRLASTRR